MNHIPLHFLAVLAVVLSPALAQTTPDQPPPEPPARNEAIRAAIYDALPWPAPNTIRLGSGAPGPDYWQQRCDYQIDATLNTDDNIVTARQTVTYTNNAPVPLDYVWIQIEQNLFRADSQGAALTPPQGARFGNRGFDGGAEIGSVVSIAVRHPEEPDGSRPEALYNHPAELRIYDTLARLDPPEPIPARGGQFVFSIEWSFHVPEYGSDRLGIFPAEQGDVYQIAQWFPAVCVYDDVYGWNTLDYLGTGEFYTDFGTFDVRITVPRDHIVGCTGVLQNPADVLTPAQLARYVEAQHNDQDTVIIRGPDEVGSPDSRPPGDGPLTWHFLAEDVRTVAWASSASFIWDARRVKDSSVGTLAQSLYPREALPIWKDSTDMLAFSIEHYNDMWFEYPYPSAINVNGRVGGMEYPMIIFCANRRNERGLFGVTTHEIGHNWFPMVVSTDERRHVWMDEGFNTFINYYAELARYPDAEPRRGSARRYARSMSHADPFGPEERRPDLYSDNVLGRLGYEKPAVGLVLLREQILGPERFDAAFREYIRRWAFKHPRPWDFCRTMEDAAGADLTWFWRGWFYSNGRLDQAVTDVRHSEGQTLITFRNLGELVMPLVYRVEYDDGSSEVRRLPVEAWARGEDEWTTGVPTAGRSVVSVTVDPDEVFPDTNPDNNVWAASEP